MPCEKPRDDCDRNAHCEHSNSYDRCVCNDEFFGDGMVCDGPRRAMAVSAGSTHSCAIIGSGKLRCWGGALYGALGNDNTSQDIGDNDPASDSAVADLPAPITQVTAGDQYTCVLFNSGDVRCWGYGFEGQLGTGYSVGDIDPKTAPNADLGAKAKALTSGGTHTCALTTAGTVRCWGTYDVGQLGYGNPELTEIPIPAHEGDVELGEPAVQVSAGPGGTCAVRQSGNLTCWGNAPGLEETVGDDETPVDAGVIDIGVAVTSVAVGRTHSCAITAAGNVRCWGANDLGQLGYAIGALVVAPRELDALGDIDVGGEVKELVVGDQYTCARLAAGSVRCWGYCGGHAYGTCFNIGDLETPAETGDIPIGGTVTQISAGISHACVLMDTGAVRCFGVAKNGVLGYGNLNDIGDDEAPATAGDVPLF